MVRAVLDEHYIGSTATWSELEERFLGLVRKAGFPQPEVNAWVTLPDGGRRRSARTSCGATDA